MDALELSLVLVLSMVSGAIGGILGYMMAEKTRQDIDRKKLEEAIHSE